MTLILIRAQVEPEERRELMQTCKTWLSSQLPTACLGKAGLRRHDADLSTTGRAMVGRGSEEFLFSLGAIRALIDAVKVLGELVDLRIAETTLIEGGE